MRLSAAIFVLAVVLVPAGILRGWGLSQGYPDFYGHVDEIGVAASVWNYFRVGSLEPTEFTYPACYSYLVAMALYLGRLCGFGVYLEDIRESLVIMSYIDPGWAALLGRWLSAVFSTATLPVLFLLGREVDGPRTGLLAVLLAAFAVLPVNQAHHALPDSTMAFVATCCFYGAWQIYRSGTYFTYVTAGLAAGLVMAIKYNGCFTALGIVAAHWLRGRRNGMSPQKILLSPSLWGSAAVAGVTLVGASPHLLISFQKYFSVAKYQISSLDFSLGQTSPWRWIVVDLIESEYLLGLLLLAGTIWAMVRRQAWDWIFLSAWIPSFLYIGSWTRESLHYLLHLYPVLALGAARLIVHWWQCFPRLYSRGVVLHTLALCLVAPNAFAAWQIVVRLNLPDTRALAADWITANVAPGTVVAMSWLPYCPRLPTVSARDGLRRHFHGRAEIVSLLENNWRGSPAYRLVNLEVWLRKPVVPEAYRARVDLADVETQRVFRRVWLSISQLRQRGVKYVVLPGAVYGRYLDMVEPPTVGAGHYHWWKNRTYFGNLTAPGNKEMELVVRFVSGPQVRGGTVDIYRLLDG